MQRLGAIPALDGLRGVAILLVLVSHAGHLRGGGMVGVYLFFALSGFLITGLLLTEHECGVIHLRGFYRRRALRLLPALTLLLVVFGVVAARAGEWVDGLVTLALGLSYSMNIAIVAGYDPGGFVHLWSLALEEQFYLVWPPLLVLLLVKRSPAVIGAGLAVAAVGFAVWRGYLEASGVTGPRLWWSPDTNAVPLLAGCCAAFAYTYLPKVPAYVGLLALPVPVLMVDWWWVPSYGLTTTLTAVAFAVLTLAVAGNGFRPLEFRSATRGREDQLWAVSLASAAVPRLRLESRCRLSRGSRPVVVAVCRAAVPAPSATVGEGSPSGTRQQSPAAGPCLRSSLRRLTVWADGDTVEELPASGRGRVRSGRPRRTTPLRLLMRDKTLCHAGYDPGAEPYIHGQEPFADNLQHAQRAEWAGRLNDPEYPQRALSEGLECCLQALYPAPTHVLFAPLSWLPFEAAMLVFTALAVASLFGGLWLLGMRSAAAFGLVLLLPPVFQAIKLGSLMPFLVLGCALCWRWRDRPFLAGVAVAATAVLKVFLWPLWLWLLFTRRYRAAVISAVAAAAMLAAGWAVFGFEHLRDYPRLLMNLSELEEDEGYSLVRVGGEWLAVAAFVALLLVGRRSFPVVVVAALVLTPVDLAADVRDPARPDRARIQPPRHVGHRARAAPG